MFGTLILMSLLSWAGTAIQVAQARNRYEQAKAAGRYAHHLGGRLEEIATYESRRAARRTVARGTARAQTRAAAGGAVAPQTTLQQFRSDVISDSERQLALDIFGIRYQTWQQRLRAKQAINQARASAYQAVLSTTSSEIGRAGGGIGSTYGSSNVGAGVGSSYFGDFGSGYGSAAAAYA